MRRAKIAGLAVLMSMSFGLAVEWAVKDMYLLSGAAAFLSWNAYIFLHYTETGEFIDDHYHDVEMEFIDRMELSLLPLFGVMIAGIPIGLFGVYLGSAMVTGAGMLTFFAGYAGAHRIIDIDDLLV